MSSQKPLVFISCGQATQEEIELGNTIESLVRELTNYEPYYAQNQANLNGVTENIFRKLYNASGFIAVMHHRGNVETTRKKIIRGSVWIEQEIAMAAFIQQILKRDIKTLIFTQQGMHREGIRVFVQANPIEFDKNEEIIERLTSELKHPEWQSLSPVQIDSIEPFKFHDLENEVIKKTREHYEALGYEVFLPSWNARDSKLVKGYEVACDPITKKEIWAGCNNYGICEHILMVKSKDKK